MKLACICFLFLIFLQCSNQSVLQSRQTTCECGLARNGRRIVGGTVTNGNSYPWMVAIIYLASTGAYQFCGGTLITPSKVLLAAHCLYKQNFVTTNIMAYLGDFDLTTASETPSQSRRASAMTIHPSYNPTTHDNDIAIITLQKPANISEYVRPLCMPPSGFNSIGKTATVAGWGTTSENGNPSSQQREVNIQIFPQDTCSKAYGTGYSKTDMICGGVPTGGKDSCQGDSGGPLFIKCNNGKYVQTGIVSYGKGCGRADYPGVYTNVASYRDFIDQACSPEKVCPNSCT